MNRLRRLSRARAAVAAAAAVVSIAAGELLALDVESLLRDPASWNRPEIRGAFDFPSQGGDAAVARATLSGRPPAICGVEPAAVTARVVGGAIHSISIVFLDGGLAFGYKNSNLDGLDLKDAEDEFDELLSETVRRIEDGLAARGAVELKSVTVAKGTDLAVNARLFRCRDATARLVVVPEQLAALDVFASEDEAAATLAPPLDGMSNRERERYFAELVHETSTGDILIGSIPMVLQENRAYCGTAILAMAGHYLGHVFGAEEFAAAAGYRYGAARSPAIREVFSAMAETAGVDVLRATSFDLDRAVRTMEAGFPVVVFRRWSRERDYIHMNYSARRAKGDPEAKLPDPNLNDQATWPGRDAPAHASIIHGWNPERREVIFTESWGEPARSRRMRAEELEGTAYYAFYFRP